MKNSVYGLILRLVSYGINTGLIEKEDIIYTQNRLLSLFHMDEPMTVVLALQQITRILLKKFCRDFLIMHTKKESFPKIQ